jgi:acetyl-CoA acetyltransferase
VLPSEATCKDRIRLVDKTRRIGEDGGRTHRPGWADTSIARAESLWQQSGLQATDIQTAILYDHFTPFTLIQSQELGFCGQGEAKDYIANGAIKIGGQPPINTHGGQLGEAYIHGMNGIAEGVRQLRGTSENQVRDVDHVLVTAGLPCRLRV